MTSIKVGLLGFGKHAREVMLPSFQEAQEIELVALATSSENFAQLESGIAAKLLNFASYQELLDQSSLDATYIALPNHLHFEWVNKALNSGKHVLCEKPLALTALEAQSICSLAREKSLLVAEAFMYRYHPQQRLVREIIASKELGEIRRLEIVFQYNLHDASNIRLRPDARGGALNDVGCYGIDWSCLILGSLPYRVSGTQRIDPRYGVDTFTTFCLTFPGEIVANITSSTELPRRNSFTIHCTKGSISVDSSFRIPRTQKAIVKIERLAEHGKTKTESIQLASANQYSLMLDGFADSIQNQNALDESLITNAQILEATRTALQSRKTVEIVAALRATILSGISEGVKP